MIISYLANEITINGTVCSLPSYIEKIMVYENIVIVLLDPSRFYKKFEDQKLRNIIALNEQCEIVWQIEEGNFKVPFNQVIYDLQTQSIKVYASHAYTYNLDPGTGKISNPVFTR